MSKHSDNAYCAPFGGGQQSLNDETHYLSRHCFVCEYQGYWVVLDARQDKYLCLTDHAVASIAYRIHGRRRFELGKRDCSPLDEEHQRLLESLTKRDILTVDAAKGKPFIDTGVEFCDTVLDSTMAPLPSITSLWRVVRFFWACAKIDRSLRTRPFHLTLKSIQDRKAQRNITDGFDRLRAELLIRTFIALRGLYPRPYLCLFDSLALQAFLALYDLHPKLVFGVVANPFEAHCWLQQGSVLLNDELERIARFKSIVGF